MSSEKPDQHGANSDAKTPPVSTGAGASSSSGKTPTPIDLEPIDNDDNAAARRSDADRPSKSVKELDVCPNCGASMRGADTLLCLRCGFDLKSMKVVKTLTGEDAPIKDEGEEKGPPIVQPGMGDFWLPTTLAALSGVLLLICYLAGAQGLFPRIAVTEPPTEIGISLRFSGLLSLVVFVGMWTACGLTALAFLAHLLGVKMAESVSDLKLAAMRMLAIVAVVRLVALIDLPNPTVEWTLEAALEVAGFAFLSMALFRLKPRDGAILTLAALITFIALWVLAHMVIWATGA